MNVDGGLDIVFNTRAELQGARQVEEQLQKQIGAAKALGQNYDELQAKLQRVQAAIKSGAKPEGPGLGEFLGKIREGLGETIPGFAKLDGVRSKFAGGTVGAVVGGFG